MSSTGQPLIVRFASDSIPDLAIFISPSHPNTISPTLSTQLTSSHTVLALSPQIRAHLPFALQRRRLRLIVAGRILNVSERIDQALRPKGKEKQSTPAGDKKKEAIYIHCVISSEDVENGDKALEQERAAAAAIYHEPDLFAISDLETPSSTPQLGTTRPASPAENNTNVVPQLEHQESAQPQGFSRLLSTGFTPQDVATLRAQFRAMTATRYTSDTMPDATALLRMEERWLNSTESGLPATTTGEGGAGGAAADEEDSPSAALNDMLVGIMAGFFWPVGAMVWGLREEGVWSRRRGWAVLGGVGVNVAFGIIRLLG